jgi:DNA-binding NarL/FixJ family response regulator
MSPGDEDDKPTVVLDLNALKKQKLAEEEKLAHIEEEIEFDVHGKEQSTDTITTVAATPEKDQFKVVLFDFQSDFFAKSIRHFPMGYDYVMATTLDELNNCLRSKDFQIVVMNYDINAKAVNQLSAQIKQKFPQSKVLIMARAISPEKAKIHAQTPSGASGYYQLPLETEKIEAEFQRIYQKKAS